MKKLFPFCCFAFVCIWSFDLYAVNPGGRADDFNYYLTERLNSRGWETNKDGWIIRVDRNRVFDRLELTCPVSTERWFSAAELDKVNGKTNDTVGLLPFEGARVRTLIIDGNEVSRKLGKCSFETISLKGVQELSRIEITGKIPPFSENRKWYGTKDDDWRRNLKSIKFVDHIGNMELMPFLGDVKCIELGEGTIEDIRANGLKGLAKCGGLERLVVPYSMAIDPSINWRKIISKTPLEDSEVLSFELGSGDDGKDGNVVLLNIASNGKISDCVTEIRADAIKDFRKTVYLPANGTNIICGRISPNVTLALKERSVLFCPDITSYEEGLKKLQDRRSLIERCPISVTTAYAGLMLTNSIGKGSGAFKKTNESRYAAYKGSILLYQGEKRVNCISAQIKLGDQVYPVKMKSSTGELRDSFYVKFNFAVGNKRFVCLTVLVTFVVIAILLTAMLLRSRKTGRFDVKQFFGAAIVMIVGVLIFVLGQKEVGILQYCVDTYITNQAISYLNSSLISSFLISVSVSAVELAVGFVQGIHVTFVAGYELNSILQPIQNVLDLISTYSWISTGVLGFLRVFIQVLKDCAHMIWGVLGVFIVVLSFFKMFGVLRFRHLIILVITVAAFLALGLPLFIWGCSWFSGQLSEIAGGKIDRAVLAFKTLAESFTLGSLLSLSAIKDLMAQFADATSNLAWAATYYVATKAFDCFVVPLFVYFGLKKGFHGFYDHKDVELTRIRELLDTNKHERIAQLTSDKPQVKAITNTEPESENRELTVASNDVFVKPTPGGIMGEIQMRLQNFAQRIKPEWVTAGCAMVICLFVAISSLSSPKEVVVVPSSPNAQNTYVIQGDSPQRSGSMSDNSINGIGWLCIIAFLIVDAWVVTKSCQVVMRSLGQGARKGDKDLALRLLKEDNFYFDLPLYLGLFGTVAGFLILSMSNGGASGRVVAYFSTVMGILVSVVIHGVVAKYRVSLYSSDAACSMVPKLKVVGTIARGADFMDGMAVKLWRKIKSLKRSNK